MWYCGNEVCTKKLHRVQFKKIKKIWEVFFTGENPVFLGLKIAM